MLIGSSEAHDMSWVINNYNNPELERNAMRQAVEEFMKLFTPQQVVDDSLVSFRIHRIDESNPVEYEAKRTLIELTKSKYLNEVQKRSLIALLVIRAYPGYEIDYSYIFDKKVA